MGIPPKFPSNPKNVKDATDAAGALEDGEFERQAIVGATDGDLTYSDMSVLGAATSAVFVSTVGVGSLLGKAAGPLAPLVKKAAPLANKAAIPVTVWVSTNEGLAAAKDYKNPKKEVKVSNVLNVTSGILGGAAVTASGTILGAPAGIVLGGASVATAGAAIAVPTDLSVNDVTRAMAALQMMGIQNNKNIINAIANFSKASLMRQLVLLASIKAMTNNVGDSADSPVSGSQQNQLMAISKTPSFNYTSHKKDSVAGYNLYQMLDNAEDTISSSTMNGFTVYVMGKTIQPTCMGDESGIGGGVKSGTVGKEIRATSGAPSILYCGYLSIRADDTCTMNNENVEGKYISLC